jgi:hypothetical protein
VIIPDRLMTTGHSAFPSAAGLKGAPLEDHRQLHD